MSVVIKVTDMSDNSVKFYNDMIEFMNEFYSEEDYNADCEDYQDRDSREKYFDELFDKERMEEFDTFWIWEIRLTFDFRRVDSHCGFWCFCFSFIDFYSEK